MEEPKQILTPEEVSRLAVMAEAELANEYLYQILEVGQTMLQCGGEVSRVEESIRRMCLAFGAERADVFTITSSIVVTVYAHKFGTLTQTRRISGTQFDLHRLELLNALSRRICAEHLGPEETARALEEVQAVPQYGPVAQMGIYALASASFSLFFGGSFADVVVSGCIADQLPAGHVRRQHPVRDHALHRGAAPGADHRLRLRPGGGTDVEEERLCGIFWNWPPLSRAPWALP